MSGYLQRLVQTAALPVQTVHPLAGSIFARSYEHESRGLELEQSAVADSPTAASADATSQHRNVPGHNPRPEPIAPRQYRRIAPGTALTPLTPEGTTDALPSVQEQLVEPARSAAHLEEDDSEPPPIFPQTEFHPLMPRDAAPADPWLAHAPFPPESRPARDGRVGARLERASDDIQIHIGRIEVTAVHPPAPRATQIPDRGLSLDSYLNRRGR